jgi:serine phosphatase RsbU (regulator of sigma subunit)
MKPQKAAQVPPPSLSPRTTTTHANPANRATGTVRKTQTAAGAPGATGQSTRAPAAGAAAVSSGRARVAERQLSGEAPAKRGGGRDRGMGLRNKFMLVLAAITVVVLAVLGVAMASTTNKFLFSIKQHSGIEVARLIAQIGISVDSQLQEQLKANPSSEWARLTTDAEKRLTGLLEQAKDWGQGLEGVSDIYGVRFANAGDFLTGRGLGQPDAGAEKSPPFRALYIPKSDQTIVLPAGLQVYEAEARIEDRLQPIYRFSIALGGRYSEGRVRVDIARESVLRVKSNLYTIIAISVLIGIGVVIAVANWLAGNITRPIDLLLRDMQVVARGKLDHVTKPHSTDEIGELAVEFNRMTQNLASAQDALVQQEKAEYELSLAREVQRQLLPAEAPQISGYDSAAFYQGAKAVSGDYFDIIPLGNGLWGFIVADVSGKGIPGSMVMAVTRTIVRLVANKHLQHAAETLKETNRLIAKQIKRGMFVTAFYAILDENTGVVTYASAGHNPMIVYRAATRSYELATAKGIAIGFNEGPIFDKTVQEAQLTLGVGDAMLLYTDGFPEAMNDQSEEFGDERFYACAAQHGHHESRVLIQHLTAEIARHRGAAEQSDDLTIIAVRRSA